jgi:NDP-sugar pyrophosphorylase family protein
MTAAASASASSHPAAVSVSSLFREADPEFVAVVLAATVGTRLLPLTSFKREAAGATPKHLLPIAGVPNMIRLLKCLHHSSFERIVLVLSEQDEVTLPVLQGEWAATSAAKTADGGEEFGTNVLNLDPRCHVQIVFVDSDCSGSAQAIRSVHKLIPATSNLVVLPGDLVLLDTAALQSLVHMHRQRSRLAPAVGAAVVASKTAGLPLPPAACTILLGDVGEVDEHGCPLKESAKSKKGGLGRDEEEIEYIALAYDDASSADEERKGLAADPSLAPRVVWKQHKVDVEEDRNLDGRTPKFVIPKPRLKSSPVTRVRLDWNDWHVYAISPWVRELIVTRSSMLSLQEDLIPLLVSRQFLGRRETFGGSLPDHQDDALLSLRDPKSESSEYAVLAHLDNDKTVYRAHSIASYMHSNREFVQRAAAASGSREDQASPLWLPPTAGLHAKYSTVLFSSNVDVKNCKGAVVGRNCVLGNKVRLNNCVIHDNVKIGDNVILQNSVVGAGASIGDNCNLNECQVAPGKAVPPGTKEKGESFE